MNSYWREKVVLITGGSAGFGLHLAEAFVAVGAKVAIAARDPAKLQAAAEQLGSKGDVLTVVADVCCDDDVAVMIAAVIARFGKLDVLVNNAGRSSRGTLLDTPLEEYRAQWELNFLSMVRVTKAAAPHVIASRGQIVNIGSLAGKGASRFIGPYATTKFPMTAFSQQLRLELAEQGVNVLLVCPGPIQRDDADTRYHADNIPAEARKPGAGVKIKGIPPARLAAKILTACEHRQPEIVLPWKARLLFAISQLSPKWGDWLMRRMTG